ncbi:hypothetical protein [Propionibacterium acidifaciens]|uniref:hypothetical protein n=1 Tax=Propionibacterium acidifaciens TaxID=556499 RepID=UPI0023EFD164|nr:hypothetical protein [Propionibacterium acidifaciens]
MIVEPLVIVSSAGLLLGLGPFLVLLGASRRAVRMGDALAVLDGRDPQQAPAQADLVHDADSALERLGAGAYTRLHIPLGERTTRLLGLHDRSIGDFVAEKIVLALAGLGAPVLVMALSALMGAPLPAPTGGLSVVAAAAGWCWPDVALRRGAERARFAADEALLTLFDLVLLERMSNRSGAQALEAAAAVSDAPVFRRVRGVLAQAGLEQRTPWSGLRSLADELRLPALTDLADIMQLDDQGASLTEPLAARVEELRDAHLTAERAAAQEVSERMTIWMALPVMVFGLAFIAPPLLRLAGLA